ncbi:MAG: hypothetical protein Q8R55_02205 [Candidatus Taylorbacteria bacterium]|nr:hypothetical protein [Candidatus Taylorbacteria bacterium]
MPKSPESGGFPPEHNPSKESPEAEWSRWKEIIRVKPQDTAYALREGKRLGVPESEIKELAQQAFDKHAQEGWYGLAYQIMKAAELGTEEERIAMGEKVYQEHMRGNNPVGAASIAKELWGENSPQYISAQEFVKKEEEKFKKEQEKAEPLMHLFPEATFHDFYAIWHDMVNEEGMGIDIEIEANMKNVFGEELTKQVMDFLNGQDDTLERKKVLDFFQEHGFGKARLREVLGIDFRKRRTKKKK